LRRTLTLGELSLESLGGSATGDRRALGCSLATAIRHYLTDRDSGRPGWRHPRFDMAGLGSGRRAEFCIEDRVWSDLVGEAAQQQVEPEDLLRHAVLLFLADRETGRVARAVRFAGPPGV
jgi:hypothetical protein